MTSPPLRKEDAEWARSDMEKTQTFANYLQGVFTPHLYEGSKDNEIDIYRTLKAPTFSQEPIQKFVKFKASTVIKSLNIRKTPGYDFITEHLLRELPDIGVYIRQ